MNPRRILILRNGSLGDTIVALPAFQMIARAFPGAQRTLLTAQPLGSRAVQLQSVLTGTGYIDDFLVYDGSAGLIQKYFQVRSHIDAVQPDVTIYLFEPKGAYSTWRDAFFLAISGAGWARGLPLTRDLRRNRWLHDIGQYEHETNRLIRVLSHSMGLDTSQLVDDWLQLSNEEHRAALQLLDKWPAKSQFIAASIGSRVPLKDWGEANWVEVLSKVSRQYPSLGLILLGTDGDYDQAVRVAGVWAGPVLNLCGQTAPRISAALMQKAALFLGNDGGSMHLAASVGTPCVAVFTSRSQKGVWFPYGKIHRVHYREIACSGCLLDECTVRRRACISSITVGEVLSSVIDTLKNFDVSRHIQCRATFYDGTS